MESLGVMSLQGWTQRRQITLPLGRVKCRKDGAQLASAVDSAPRFLLLHITANSKVQFSKDRKVPRSLAWGLEQDHCPRMTQSENPKHFPVCWGWNVGPGGLPLLPSCWRPDPACGAGGLPPVVLPLAP